MAKIYQFPFQQQHAKRGEGLSDSEYEDTYGVSRDEEVWDEDMYQEWLADKMTPEEIAELEEEEKEMMNPWWLDSCDRSDLENMGSLVDNGCAYDSDDDM